MTPAQENILRWRRDPVEFVRDNFHVEPDKWQAAALRAFASNDPAQSRISLQACAGPGKSTVLAWCGWNFLVCYAEPGEHPKGAAMSVTSDNLKDNLWSEFSKWQGRSPFLMRAFKWTKERIFAVDHPQTWFISARTFPKTADAEEQGRTLSGLHSKFILYLIDESGDISPSVLRAAEQGLATKPAFGKIMQAGNPTSLTGMLYAAAHELRDKWHLIRINGDPEDPNRSPRIDEVWAAEQIETYGRDNPWVMSYILGLFPPSSINSLLGVDEVEAAMARHLRPDAYSWSQKRLGIDAARFGVDPWVIFPRQGLAAFRFTEMRNPRTEDVVARVALAKQRWNSEMEFFDGTGGFAAGAIDGLIQAGYSPQEISFSGKAIDPRYYNKRSEMWFLMAAWVKRGGALPRDGGLLKELTTPIYWFDKGKFRLEEKEQIMKRLRFSPNKADALSLTFAMPDMPGANSDIALISGYGNGNHKNEDFDPNRSQNGPE